MEEARLTPRFVLRVLDPCDSAILKGLAISAIVFHNFFHFVSPVHQNEFTFLPSRFPVFLETVIHPSLAIQALFSFFGHFGVDIFVFLSAYGLSKSHWDDPATWSLFMWGRIKKLYPTFGLVVIPWFFAVSVALGPLEVIRQVGLGILLMSLGVSTLLGFGLPPVGPWWFIPFIVQFYAIWPLMRKMTAKFGWQSLLILAVLSLAATYAFNPLLAHWSVDLLMTQLVTCRSFVLESSQRDMTCE